MGIEHANEIPGEGNGNFEILEEQRLSAIGTDGI
jgi:hypothetical protein